MKKISLLLVVLLAAGSASLYGQMMIGTEFKISGDATATAGYDIDEEQFGFSNEANANITLELVATQSVDNAEMVGMEGWVGSIYLNDFKIVINSDEEDSELRYNADECWIDSDNDGIAENQPNAADCEANVTSRSGLVVTEPTIVAKLKNGPLWLQIFDSPGNVADKVAAVEDDEETEDDPTGGNAAESDDLDHDVATDLDGVGISVGYTSADGDLHVGLGITSEEPHDAGTPEDNSFALSADLKVNVGPADLELQVVQGLAAAEEDLTANATADDTGVGALLKTTFGDVTLSAGADMIMTGLANDAATAENESLQFEVGVGADMTLTENTMFGAKYIYSSVQAVASDVKVILSDKSGLVDRLSMGLTWGLFDISNGDADGPPTENDGTDMLVKGNLGYDLDAMGGTLTPSAELTLNQVDDDDATVGLTVKAVLTNAVPATEFGLQWTTASLTDVGDADSEQGAISAWAKITYG